MKGFAKEALEFLAARIRFHLETGTAAASEYMLVERSLAEDLLCAAYDSGCVGEAEEKAFNAALIDLFETYGRKDLA